MGRGSREKGAVGTTMENLQLIIPIEKIDVERRLVYGTIVAEEMDKTGEIFDYASSKPHFEAWSDEISKATGGKSVGNVRAMHTKKAAGRFEVLEFDDNAKKIRGAAKIVDDEEWMKCVEGVYTAFSFGGPYVRRWVDGEGKRRYTARPAEVSIVDNPAMPGTHFELMKADGTSEQREFKNAEKTEDPPTTDGAAAAETKPTEKTAPSTAADPPDTTESPVAGAETTPQADASASETGDGTTTKMDHFLQRKAALRYVNAHCEKESR